MAKIVFVDPPLSLADRYSTLASAGNTLAPLGLLYLAAAARSHAHEAAIVEASAYSRFEDAVEAILRLQPEHVAITATTVSILNAAALGQKIKERNARVTVLIGGPHVTAVPEQTMERCRGFDIGVIGEGEDTLIELLRALGTRASLHDVAGIVFRDGGRTVITPKRQLISDLDALPMPAWDLMPDFPQGYIPGASKFRKLPAAYILTSRGCPYKCIFCDTSVFQGKCRYFSAAYVVEMVRTLYLRYGVREISFEDDTLLASKERLATICESLIRDGLRLSWSCNSRVDSVNPGILKLMKRAGCWQIGFGIESGVQSILDFAKKNITLAQVERAVDLTRAAGITSKGFFILGFPGDTAQTMRQTIDFAKKIRLDDITLTLMTPFPGSELYKTAAEYGEFDEDWRKMSLLKSVFVPRGLTEAALAAFFKQALREFYLRPRIMFGYMRRIISSPAIGLRILKGFMAFLRTVS